MSCIAVDPCFRLLDSVVGWDAASANGLTGLDDVTGVRLAGNEHALSEGDIDPFIPPPMLAASCGPCDWFLATPPWPVPRLLRLSGCNDAWASAWERGCVSAEFTDVTAIAFDRDLLAVADAGAGRALVLTVPGMRIIGEAACPAPVALDFGPRGTLVIAGEDGNRIEVFSVAGRALGHWPAPLPQGRVERLAHDRDAWLWLVMRGEDESLRLYRQIDLSGAFAERDLAALAAAFPPTTLAESGFAGFSLRRGDGTAAPLRWDWAGRPMPALPGVSGGRPAAPDRLARQGQLLTLGIDSGVERCAWHRIRIGADVPDRTALEVAVATNDRPDPVAQGVPLGAWQDFAAGVPHPADWQVIEAGALDALIRQPVGRYLFLRLRLTGDGQATPHVRRIHLDLPRATSAGLLPAVFREEPKSADFTERFLALFDAGLETIDACVARLPAALDAESTDPELLPWLATILGIGFDPAWDVATRRRLLKGAPALFRKRGTPSGLRLAFELIADNGRPGAGALIDEPGVRRPWGAVASSGADAGGLGARLGITRLFSPSSARVRLGSSRIGEVPVLSYGDPDDDARETGAFRFSVSVPADVPMSEEMIRTLVDSQKPAHTLAAVRKGGAAGFVMSGLGRLGIDTMIRHPDPLVLGKDSMRLGANSIVGGGMRRGMAAGPFNQSNAGSVC